MQHSTHILLHKIKRKRKRKKTSNERTNEYIVRCSWCYSLSSIHNQNGKKKSQSNSQQWNSMFKKKQNEKYSVRLVLCKFSSFCLLIRQHRGECDRQRKRGEPWIQNTICICNFVAPLHAQMNHSTTQFSTAQHREIISNLCSMAHIVQHTSLRKSRKSTSVHVFPWISWNF